jgi:adenylate cyclase
LQRRLAAIMAADMVGYSRLMAADESETIARHKSNRKELIDPRIADHGGRIFKATGDGFLAEFSSTVDAVQCAVEIQRAIHEQEPKASIERRIQYRIGINLGDVVVDEGDIFGDGVNVAARLEQLADAGGVCISDVVYRNVKSKLELKFEGLGARPSRTFRVKSKFTASTRMQILPRRLTRPPLATNRSCPTSHR